MKVFLIADFIAEIQPISYYGRTYEEGKKIGYLGGAAALWYILKHSCPAKLFQNGIKVFE